MQRAIEGTRVRMLSREDDVEAHALRARGWSISAIARHLNKDRGLGRPAGPARHWDGYRGTAFALVGALAHLARRPG